MSDDITITLSRNESLVFFEFLSRYTEEGRLDIQDQAEQRVLWNLQAALESALPEPFAHDYLQHLQRARQSVRDTIG